MRWASLVVPRARSVSTCVSPRVKRPDPCVRGARPVSTQIGRISSAVRPSGRCLSTAMRWRMVLLMIDSNASENAALSSDVGSSPSTAPRAALLASEILSRRSSLPCSRVASSICDSAAFSTFASIAGSTVFPWMSHFGLPASFRSSSCTSQSFLISSCAIWSASRRSSSLTSLAPASTIEMASRVPATTRSSVDSSSSCRVGLMTKSSSIMPMRTAPTGPWNGSSLSMSAADAPLIDRMSNALTLSMLSTVVTICTSLRKPLGHSGRSGRSVMRHVRIARSLGRLSRLMKPPGIAPLAYMRSSTSTVRGKKSVPSRGSRAPTAVTSTRLSPERTSTDPFACFARRPVSKMISWPPMSATTRVASGP